MSATTDLVQRLRGSATRTTNEAADTIEALQAERDALRADAERYALAKTLEGQVVVMETLKNLGASWLDEKLDELAAENDSIDAAMKGANT
jgi:hypothetical protein